MTKTENIDWLKTHGFDYVCSDTWDEVYERYMKFTRTTRSEEELFLVRVNVSKKNGEAYAELFAGSLSFTSSIKADAKTAVDQVLNDVIHMTESVKLAALNILGDSVNRV